MGYLVKNRQHGINPIGVTIPGGTDADRPADIVAVAGSVRFNTTDGTLEFFNGAQYLKLVTPSAGHILVENFVGDGIEDTFTMSKTPSTADQILVFISGIHQDPGPAYVTAANSLVLSEVPNIGVPIIVVHDIGLVE